MRAADYPIGRSLSKLTVSAVPAASQPPRVVPASNCYGKFYKDFLVFFLK